MCPVGHNPSGDRAAARAASSAALAERGRTFPCSLPRTQSPSLFAPLSAVRLPVPFGRSYDHSPSYTCQEAKRPVSVMLMRPPPPRLPRLRTPLPCLPAVPLITRVAAVSVHLAILILVQPLAVPPAVRPLTKVIGAVRPHYLSVPMRYALAPVALVARPVGPHHPPLAVRLPLPRLALEADVSADTFRAEGRLDLGGRLCAPLVLALPPKPRLPLALRTTRARVRRAAVAPRRVRPSCGVRACCDTS